MVARAALGIIHRHYIKFDRAHYDAITELSMFDNFGTRVMNRYDLVVEVVPGAAGTQDSLWTELA